LPHGGRDQRVLAQILETARDRGFIGPGDLGRHLAHAEGFAEVVETTLLGAPASFCDLGSGGGIPGLVLATCWHDARGALIDANARRCTLLREAVSLLGADDRIKVVEGRAEEIAHDPAHREQYDVVVARSFAGPAPTAEIATGLVRVGGIVVVSEPPGGAAGRWPDEHLAQLGLGAARITVLGDRGSYAVMRKDAMAPKEFPRAVGRPAKRPLW
jgi:16S rRNA (guanine527-N7)-methyltransferase